MKTQLRIRSLRYFVVSATVAALLNIVVLAQPHPDRASLAISSIDRLEIFVENSEAGLKYTAPSDKAIDMEKEQALDNLEHFAVNSESTLKYTSPVEFEDQINKELDVLANTMIDQLEYRAPVYDEFTNTFSKPLMSALKSNTRPVVAEECSAQEAWLINAGYYKSSRKSLVQKTRTEEFSEKYTDKL